MTEASDVEGRRKGSARGPLRHAARMPRRNAVPGTRASGRTPANVDPGTANDHSTKITLARKVNGLLDEEGLSQSAAAQRLGIPQSKVSAIRNYKLHGISLERLMQALVALNQRVEIVVTPSATSPHRAIAVVV